MVNSDRNRDCHDNPEGCWTCQCGKHHNCKEGADWCCTTKVSQECGCRHCSARKKEGTK